MPRAQTPETSRETQDSKDFVEGLVLTATGLGVGFIGLDGINSHEAQQPSDALGSVSMADKEAFVVPEDLAFGTVVLIGVVAVSAGSKRLLRALHWD